MFGPESNFIDSETIKWEQGTRGIIARAQVRPGGAPAATIGARYIVKSTMPNYTICRTFNGVTEGSVDIKIAKPYSAQQPSTETIAGAVINYTYAAGPDALNQVRTAVSADPNLNIGEEQIVIPYWAKTGTNAIILAIGINNSGVTDENGVDIGLIEVSARCWAGPIPYT